MAGAKTMNKKGRELDFYFPQEQVEMQRLIGGERYDCYFKGKLYTECAPKGIYGAKNNYPDSVYLGSGYDSDITLRRKHA